MLVPQAATTSTAASDTGQAPPAGSIAEGIAKIMQEHDSQRRMGKFFSLVDGITAENGREAAEAIRKLTNVQQKTWILSLALSSWAQADPKAAMDYAGTLPKGQERTQALLSALGGWARKDMAAAQQWADVLQAVAPGAVAA